MRVLLIEDHRPLVRVLTRGLEEEGFAVDVAEDGEDGDFKARSTEYDAIILDVMLPKIDGMTLLEKWRADGITTHVLMLTARGNVEDKVRGLNIGADDYLVKPFEFDELTARMRAVLRRHGGRAAPVLACGGVTLDPATRQVSKDGQPVLLSSREFAVLEALMTRPGALLSRAQLEDRLYGWGEEIESNAVSVYIHQLRRKLGAEFIGNVRGVGYYVGQPGGGGT